MLVAVVVGVAGGDPTESSVGGTTLETLKAMRIGELMAFLAARGQECKGCAEKADFVQLAYAHRDDPVKEAAKKEEPPKKAEDLTPEDLEKLLDEAGLKGKFKMFGRDEMDKMAKATEQKKQTKGDDEEL